MYCFAISIPRFRERHAYIAEHLARFWGPDFEIIGIDGDAAGQEISARTGLTPGQVGCALSHLAVYETLVARKIPWALVVEDDVVLPHDIHDILVRIEATLRRGDVVLLYNRPQHLAAFSTVDAVSIGDYRLCLPMSMSGLGTTAAYVITRQAAEGILAANRPIVVAADNWTYFYERRAVSRARVMSPNAVAVQPFESTIFASGSKVGAFLRSNRILRPLLTARRKFLTTRMAANMVFVDEVSPYANISPQ
ncbi:glycosyltransferase family 25 protein [Methylobacterium sp. NEAU K]|uniref:glycosyltransferase family 25 protein n=1 Tax=Methylobacterium sp. NEAU K TaxID=3064946 RepID=UPI002733E1FB|nr:glycosyltransferase family 25 protein [Methylobacterium sp. NEAU K]MDP4004960.1 glycosyltransferase family 25 protein [Methylobacterium sp. NEAU K]